MMYGSPNSGKALLLFFLSHPLQYRLFSSSSLLLLFSLQKFKVFFFISFPFHSIRFRKCRFHPHPSKSCMHYKRTERREMMIPLFPFLLSCLRFTIGLAWTIHLQQYFPDQQHKYCWSGARLPLSQTGNARFPPILSSVPLFISRY